MIGPALLLLVLLGAVASSRALRHMLAEAWRTMDPRAVAAVLPVQLAAILLCTAAQQALKVGIPFRSSFIARLVRDAAHNLLIFPGLGEVVGARAVVVLGGRGRAAVALRALDLTAEVLAELPYMGLAFWVLWRWWHAGGALAAPAGAQQGLAGAGWRWARCWCCWARPGWRRSAHHQRWRQSRTGRRVRAETHLMRRELARQKAGMPLAIGFHMLAWGFRACRCGWRRRCLACIFRCSARWRSRARPPRRG
jgi:hypothetical protein